MAQGKNEKKARKKRKRGEESKTDLRANSIDG
jgi:hypothetical protein